MQFTTWSLELAFLIGVLLSWVLHWLLCQRSIAHPGDDQIDVMEGIGAEIRGVLKRRDITRFAQLSRSNSHGPKHTLDAQGPSFKIVNTSEAWAYRAKLLEDRDILRLVPLTQRLRAVVSRSIRDLPCRTLLKPSWKTSQAPQQSKMTCASFDFCPLGSAGDSRFSSSMHTSSPPTLVVLTEQSFFDFDKLMLRAVAQNKLKRCVKEFKKDSHAKGKMVSVIGIRCSIWDKTNSLTLSQSCSAAVHTSVATSLKHSPELIRLSSPVERREAEPVKTARERTNGSLNDYKACLASNRRVATSLSN